MTQTYEKPARQAMRLLIALLDEIKHGSEPVFNAEQRRFLDRNLADLRNAMDDFGDAREALHDRREVAVVWCIEDVQGVRPDLTDEQAWDVLQECERRHDCEYGFTWTYIECIAADLYPVPDRRKPRTSGGRP